MVIVKYVPGQLKMIVCKEITFRPPQSFIQRSMVLARFIQRQIVWNHLFHDELFKLATETVLPFCVNGDVSYNVILPHTVHSNELLQHQEI